MSAHVRMTGSKSDRFACVFRWLCFIAYGAGILSFTIVGKPSVNNILTYLFDQPEMASGWPWLMYWLIGTFSPIILSILTWFVVYRYRARLLPHLIFIPAAILVHRLAMLLFMQSSSVRIEDMKEADAVILAVGYLLLCLVVHTMATVIAGVQIIRTWVGGR
ncbi:hypothetical protein [Sphingomonas sp.]|uniref:hypothetical protein n=1 Tax=Sphingomonas sp. TaxID=28214 RepID=UPI002DD6B042|nr:hypothetical protein [Sphingomonas sp.]